MYIAALLCALLHCGAVAQSDGTCNADDVECEQKQQSPVLVPRKNWDKYLSKIEKAVADYRPCAHTNCSCYEDVLERDFQPFEDGITRAQVELMKDKAIKYQIISHRVYRAEKCLFGPRCLGIEHFLHLIASELPDMEFYVNPRDYPHAPKHMPKTPVLSFSKIARQEYDLLYPAWSFWAGGPAIKLFPTGIGRWDLLRDELKTESEKYPWPVKQSMAFFRGSRTSEQRDPLVLLSRRQPQLVDAQYTKNQAYKGPKDTLGAEPASEIHFRDHCQYKYLFNFRGVAASFRFKHLFLCGSLVFHVGDDWVEFFYDGLKPWVHYIPMSTKLDELEEMLEFVRDNDQVAQQIAERGFDFIWNHLRQEDVVCYWRMLLKKFASLQNYKVKLDKNLILRTPKDRH